MTDQIPTDKVRKHIRRLEEALQEIEAPEGRVGGHALPCTV